MGYGEKLEFTRDLLAGLNISSCILTQPEERIPPEVDMGLRKMLFDTDNYYSFLENSLQDACDRTIYRFCDEYDCKYIFMRLPEGSFLFIGPYLMSSPDMEYAEKSETLAAMPETKRQQLIIYYTNLPVIEDENWLLTLANTLGQSIWGASGFSMEYIDYIIRDRSVPIPLSRLETDPYDAALSLSALEANYDSEKLLMEAVSKGKLHLVTAAAGTVYNNGAEPRLSDSLRDRKNNLIILKTLLRKAAEYGGVHPLHIHRLSSAYAQRIEKVRTIRESLRLQEEMIRDFCQLVKKHSLSRYSYYVGKTITLVHYDLTADLSLHAIAGQLNVNDSYLSKLFHKECGCTLTAYVNRQRLERSAMLLRDGSKTIQDVATDCGFQDSSYFIRLFKKHFGMTPAVYREQSM